MARNVEFNEDEKVEKAMNVFWEKGYNGTSMQDLVDAMQINRSSLYNTIGDKHELFLKCINNYTCARMSETIEKAKSAKSPLEAINCIIRDKVDLIIHNNRSCLSMQTSFEVAPIDKDVRELLKKSSELFLQLVISLIVSAMEAGEIDSTENPEMVADYICTSFTGWQESFVLHGDPIKIKKMSEYLIRIITHK